MPDTPRGNDSTLTVESPDVIAQRTGKTLEAVTVVDMVVLQQPEPIKPRPKVKGLTNARLRRLAATHKPPQSWYEEDQEGLY